MGRWDAWPHGPVCRTKFARKWAEFIHGPRSSSRRMGVRVDHPPPPADALSRRTHISVLPHARDSSNGSTSQKKERAAVMGLHLPAAGAPPLFSLSRRPRLSNRKYSPSPLLLCIYYELANEEWEEKSSRAGAGAPAPATQASPNQSEIHFGDQATQGISQSFRLWEFDISQSFSVIQYGFGKGFSFVSIDFE